MSHQSNNFADLAAVHLTRRGFVAATAALPALSLLPAQGVAQTLPTQAAKAAGFAGVAENRRDDVVVPEQYEWHRLISWGDPLFEGVADAKPAGRGAPFALSRAEQEMRFGTHNDMNALFPINWSYPWPQGTYHRALMCTNHESVSPFLAGPGANPGDLLTDATAIEAYYACMGVTVMELAHDPASGHWRVVKSVSPQTGPNRRITPFTEVVFDGPAKSHPWIKAASAQVNAVETAKTGATRHRKGVKCGTFQNCAGGFTPWGTYLTAEENFQTPFYTSDPNGPALAEAKQQGGYRFDQASYGYNNIWRFGGPRQYDLSTNPHGPQLYGWIVEIDPYDPSWAPRKRTSMGRKANECATCVITKDGRIASYMGDDTVNQFVYKFVTKGRFNPRRRTANRDLLSKGTLYVARLEADGTGTWLEMTAARVNAAARGQDHDVFVDDGDVMIRAREAALLLGATKMDRPEDVESPVDESFKGTGSVFIMCTGNMSDAGRPGNAANPRRPMGEGEGLERNFQGHIVRLDEADQDSASLTFTWDIFAVAGDPAAERAIVTNRDGARVNASSWLNGQPTTQGDRFAMPDNITFDKQGFAWVTTDGNADTFPCNDGIYVMPVSGTGPRAVKRFLTVPVGAEVCGPLFAPDQKTFFCNVQHVGSSSLTGKSYRGEAQGPYSSFPDGGWPRDSVVYVRRKDGGVVGT